MSSEFTVTSTSLGSGHHHQCPFCHRSVKTCGGGITNHIYRSGFCYRKKIQTLRILKERARRTSQAPLMPLTPLASPSAPSIPPLTEESMDLSLDDPFLSMIGLDTTVLNTTSTSNNAAQRFQIFHNQEDVGFIFLVCQETLWKHLQSLEDACQPYTPWRSDTEWELIYWLSMSQLS